ncbi:hypothetical protein VNO78_15933 [Psophocarpus tetragonolobus]|uniref:Disease resistance protein At4g27190-like leucine-rich repeats domain-containing protein n=1 Tax=Psophocarpus tetragonolobus TaxID=3891 RepID=A0AAN9SHD4_PSOTE
MEPVVSTTTESALQIGGGVIKRQVGYFFNYNDKLEEVKQYLEMLDNARQRLRYRLGRRATKVAEEIKVEELWNKRFDKVSHRSSPSINVALLNICYESFGSRNKTLEMIMKALEDSTVNMIGVYGVGGVGQIAEMLGMRLEEESEIVRADRIRKRLKKERGNTLIILDDLWDGLDLNRLGIPCGDDDEDSTQQDVKDISDFCYNKIEEDELSTDFNQLEKDKSSVNHKGCKILLTSRSKEVICNQMNVQERSTFWVGVIDKKEAETLLKKVAGIHGTDSMFDGKATAIAQMCAGLPIALVSIGRALKNKSSVVWDAVCQQIKRQSFTEEWESIEFSVKLRVHTIKEARYRVNAFIEELKESSLLVESYSTDRFNMHDIVRDVSLSISSQEKHVLFMKNDILDEWPHKDELESTFQYHIKNEYFGRIVYERHFLWEAEENIQSQNASLSELRHLNELRNLDIRIQSLAHFPQNLFFDKLDSYNIVIGEVNMLTAAEFKIPDKYEAVKLLALNLKEDIDIHSEKWIKMLFKGVEYLLLGEINDVRDVFYELNVDGFPTLKHLFVVNNCSIQYITKSMELAFPKLESMCLYKLENLEKICGSQLTEASLCSLKIIKIKTCDKLENLFPFSMVKLLTMLESIEVCECDYLKEIVSVERQTQTIIDDKIEFRQLRHLTLKSLPAFICVYMNDISCSTQSLEDQERHGNKDIVTEVEQDATNSCLPLFNEKVSMTKLEWLELSSINIQKIWSDQSRNCFQKLLTLEVSDCEDIENNDIFPKLKKMEIICMDKLTTIWQPHIGLHSFRCLDTLIIRQCHKLVTIFPSYMEQRTQSLHSLTITNCNLVENIFGYGNIPQTCDRNETNLQNVFLEALPNLVHIWKDNNCEILKCNNLQILNVVGCPNLKYLFPLSIAKDLEKLEILQVWNCGAMKEIVAWDEGSNENDITFKFPCLKIVSLQSSHELMSFYHGSHTLEWPSLKKLLTLNCDKLEGLTAERTNSQVKPIVLATKKVIYSLEFMAMNLKQAEWLQKYLQCGRQWLGTQQALQCLKKLELDAGSKRDIVIPSHILPYLKNLEELNVHNCLAVQAIFDIEDVETKTKGRVFRLKKLTLKDLPNLKCVWYKNPKGIANFPNLQEVVVINCVSLATMFPSSLAKNLGKLKKLNIEGCRKLVEIVGKEDSMKHGTNEIFEFPCLLSLIIWTMPQLTCFYPGEHYLECPMLEILRVPSLELLRVQTCFGLKEIFPTQKLQAHNGILQRLKELFLFNLKELESIGLEHPWVKSYSEKLQALRLLRCPQLENIVSCSVSFINLKEMAVTQCVRMEYLFNISTAKSLVLLETLIIKNCVSIKEKAKKEDEDDSDEIIFQRLTKLTLVSLPKLVSFYSGNATLQFSCLATVIVAKCSSMETFSQGVIKSPMLLGIQTSLEDSDLIFHNDLNTTIERLFYEQVFLEYSRQMILVNYMDTARVQHGKHAFTDNFFGYLKKLELNATSKGDIVIPSLALPYLKSLEEVNVHSSNAVQVIFDIDSETKTNGIVIGLKKLILEDLPNLTCVWNKNPGGIVSFANLKEVVVTNCGSLVTLFPSSIAKSLWALEIFQIERCDKLVEIVGKEDTCEAEATEMFEFPCLSWLNLWCMPLLSCFYPGKHHLECPVLKSLLVGYCPKLKLFTSEFHDTHKQAVIEDELGSIITSSKPQQPLFSIEKVVSTLKELTLNEKNLILLSKEHLPQDFLRQLNLLRLSFEDNSDKKDTLPFDFLRKLPHLAHLQVQNYPGIREIFPSHKLQGPDGILARLKELLLFKMKVLESIGLEHPWEKPYLERLQILHIEDCPGLEKIACYAVSFTNLKEMVVRKCERMAYLFKFSTAKSLVQLQTLIIENCESIKEIVRKEDEDGYVEIIFQRLIKLTLNSLPCLVSFYSGNANLQFPRLAMAMVAKCPSIETFSKGVVNSPFLLGIQTLLGDSDLTFHHDLKTTIESLFYEQVFFEYAKQMVLVEFLETTGLQQHKPAFLNFFGSLKKLEYASNKREIVIPSHALPYLKSLEEVNVHSCSEVNVIFDIDDCQTKANGIVFHLKKLTLRNLSNLICVWNKSPRGILSFPNLQEVVVTNCRRLKTLFPSSLAKNLGNLENLIIEMCDKLEEIVGKEDTVEQKTVEMFEFPCLYLLTLWNMPLLRCFYPVRHSLECHALEILHISWCPKLKVFTFELNDSHKEAVVEGEIRSIITSSQAQPLFSAEKVTNL